MRTTTSPGTGTHDEALERFHTTGPEYDGYLSNHGPMVVEALARLDRPDLIHPWTDRYLQRLDEAPRGTASIGDDWRTALGDAGRTADWIAYFTDRSDEQDWTDLLATWWPRLVPGIAAGATHGVIRVGHAVRALRESATEPRHQELRHALAYWAARWQVVPMLPTTGRYDVATALAGVPQVADQTQGIGHRLAQLPDTAGWEPALRALAGPTTAPQVPEALEALVSGVLTHYATHAHGNPTMLVHAATAPMAVRNTLPSLPPHFWLDSFDAAWSATGAVVAAYTPDAARPVVAPTSPDDVLAQALSHGGEHVIKLTDTALAIHELTGDLRALSAALTAVALDA